MVGRVSDYFQEDMPTDLPGKGIDDVVGLKDIEIRGARFEEGNLAAADGTTRRVRVWVYDGVEEFFFITGSVYLRRKLDSLKRRSLFPIIGTITKTLYPDGRFKYDIE